MMQSVAIACFTLAAFGAPCLGSNIDRSCVSGVCNSEDSSPEDEVSMLQVGQQQMPKESKQMPGSVLQRSQISIHNQEERAQQTSNVGHKNQKLTRAYDEVVFTCDFINTDTNQPAKADGLAPTTDGKFPLAVFTQGTKMPYSHAAADGFLGLMVDRGFVAIIVEYSNMKYAGHCSKFEAKAKNVAACIDQFCDSYDKVDCSKGVATYGYSQGGQIASLLGTFNHKVTASLAISASILNHGRYTDDQKDCFDLSTPRNKRRILIGDKDGHFAGNGVYNSGTAAEAIENALHMSGYDDGTCTEETLDCIQPDGSGYYVATTADSGIPDMNHYWFMTFYPVFGLNPVFEYADASAQWGATATMDWLAKAATTP